MVLRLTSRDIAEALYGGETLASIGSLTEFEQTGMM